MPHAEENVSRIENLEIPVRASKVVKVVRSAFTYLLRYNNSSKKTTQIRLTFFADRRGPGCVEAVHRAPRVHAKPLLLS